jgi:hypothetical protein
MAAVADADVGVRSSVFKALYRNPAFDDFLAQADILTSIFVALNDEVGLLDLLPAYLMWCLLDLLPAASTQHLFDRVSLVLA